MTFNVDTDQLRTHANHVGSVESSLGLMADAGSPDEAAYGELLSLLSVPSWVTDSVDSVWEAISQAYVGAGQVENGINHMAARYDADDDLATFLLKPNVPLISQASSPGQSGRPSMGPSGYAAAPEARSKVSGAGILDSGTSTIKAFKDEDWVDVGLSGVSVTLDAAATAADPLGSVLAAGFGWALDHVEPIKGWFDDVTGNPESVAAKGESWGNIANGLDPLADSWQSALDKIEWMSGEAIASYKAQADARIKTLRRLKGSSESASEALAVLSGIVTFVHNFLRDILASLAGAIISWATQTFLSLGTLIPWVCTQIATRVASVVNKCRKYITALTKSGTKLATLLKSLKTFADDILRFLNKITPNPNIYAPRHAGPPGPQVPAGPWRPPEGWKPPKPAHAPTPLENLGKVPSDLPWRDAGVNSGVETAKGQTPEPAESE